MLVDLSVAFALVFVAELGDKSQLVALAAAGRHGAARTIAALAGAIAVLQTLSVTAGAAIAVAVPDRAIGIATGVLFLAFGVWTWHGAYRDRVPSEAPRESPTAGLGRVTALFFLAEFGDKTMITTAGLAADRSVVPVWIGSTAAMVTATVLAVLAGSSIAKRVSIRSIRRLGAAAFLIVGALTLAAAFR